MNYRIVAGTAFAVAVAVATLAPRAIQAGEGDYIGLFKGTWAGSGTVLNDAKPWQVACKAVGQPSTNHLIIKGNCRVLLVNVAISANITYDPNSGRYTGTYTGGDMAAEISGKRNGDTVDFAMIWAKPIDRDGNRQARLTIVNAGHGDFRILIDNLKANGPEERTSDLLLTQAV